MQQIRIERDVLTVTVGSHAELETLPRGYNRAYNARPQKVLAGRRPIEVVRERLRAEADLANPAYRPPPGCDLLAAFVRLETNDLSQPHN